MTKKLQTASLLLLTALLAGSGERNANHYFIYSDT